MKVYFNTERMLTIMTYFFGGKTDSAKADYILSASNGNFTLTPTKGNYQTQIIDSVRFLGERKLTKFEPIVQKILQGIPANASIQFREAGISAINKIAQANHTQFPFG